MQVLLSLDSPEPESGWNQVREPERPKVTLTAGAPMVAGRGGGEGRVGRWSVTEIWRQIPGE